MQIYLVCIMQGLSSLFLTQMVFHNLHEPPFFVPWFGSHQVGLATLVERAALGSAGMTASTLETACAISPAGNLAFKVDFGNTPDFDGLTAGMIRTRLYWIAN